MRIVSARFRNVFCFRGEHELELDPKVYALVARYEGEEGRSNWGGKSALLRVLGPLPLFGWHGMKVEDDWIADGEDEAEVELRFDDDSSVRRWRRRGRSTQAEFKAPGVLVGQKGAEEAIAVRLGLSESDFFATQYVRQKQIDRLLTVKPAERHELVVGWFDLGGLEKCEEETRRGLSDANRQLADLERQAETLKGLVEQLDASLALEPGETVESTVQKLRSTASTALQNARDLDEVSTRVEKIRAAQRAKAELDRVEARGKELAAELKTKRPNIKPLELAVAAAQETSWTTEQDVVRLRVLARGEFDGTCPVAGITCPATASINSDSQKHRAELGEALAAALAAKKEADEARRAMMAAHSLERTLAAKKGELDEVTRRWRSLKTDATGADDLLPEGDPSAEARAWQIEAARAEARAEELERAAASVEDARARLAEVVAKIEGARERRDRYAEAMAVFGRQGAQRRCAETYLSRIETAANDLLSTSGIDLRVAASWAREGQTPARTCARCGEPFPSSAKIKQCGRCGAPRGANIVEKLDLSVSARSDGGAADLGGLGLQLAAGAWLRARRGSRFSVAYLDEPLAALDAANRASVSRALVGMLSGRYGLKQSFVVAHSTDALEACPGRLEIVIGRDGSRSVVAA